MGNLKEFWNSFDEATRKAVCIGLAIIFVFSSGNFVGSLTKISANPVAQQSADSAPATQQVVKADATTAAPSTEAPATEAPATEAPATQAPAAETTASAEAAAPQTGAYTTTEEIVALFNESAGKIKTTATKATRNYQQMNINKLELPSALQAIADSAIEKYAKGDSTPQEYIGTAEVAEKYPVSGTDFASKLKPEYVETITCTDNGTEYVIDIKMKDQMNPVYRSGEGVASIFWTMNIDDIANNVPGLQKAELSYYDCKATAKIDKATGNMTYSKFDYNFDMILEVKMLATLNANASMTVVEEYVIEY